MKSSQPEPPTRAQFVAAVRTHFSFLSAFGFNAAPPPGTGFVNEFQVRFSNGKLIVIVEGIFWGMAAQVHLMDSAGVTVPLILFVPSQKRERPSKRPSPRGGQLAEIGEYAQYLRDHCVDLLQGDMARFYDRAAEWQRITSGRSQNQNPHLP